MRKCKFPKCGTILRKRKNFNFCSLHFRVLKQNEVTYHRGRYYKGEKDKKKILFLSKAMNLKEILSPEEFFAMDRL